MGFLSLTLVIFFFLVSIRIMVGFSLYAIEKFIKKDKE